MIREDLTDEIEPEKYQYQADEDQLIQSARANPAAFEGLYNHYVTRVYRYVYARVNSRDEALDLTQQIFRDTPRPVERDGLLSNVAGVACLRRDRT